MRSSICFPVFVLMLFASCAESIEEQRLQILEQNRTFEVELEERRYGFGYLISNEDDSDRPLQNLFEETIFLTTDEVHVGGDPLSGVSQVIRIMIVYIGTEKPDEIVQDFFNPTANNRRVLITTFVEEDFSFTTGTSLRRSRLNQGEIKITIHEGGAHTVSLDAAAGGISIVGSWTGTLRSATVSF